MQKIDRSKLAMFYEGADSPTQMGTTGLIAWVLQGLPSKHHPRNRWERFEVAARIIKGRGLSISCFVDAIITTAFYYGIRLRRFYQATRRMVGTTQLRPEIYEYCTQY